MKVIKSEELVVFPDTGKQLIFRLIIKYEKRLIKFRYNFIFKVKVTVNARVVTVTGPRGTLQRSFKHSRCTITKVSPTKIVVTKVFGLKKEIANVRTIASHINNLVKGVTKGFRYKMRFVYAHFPINTAISEAGQLVEIRNFLGERLIRKVRMYPGVTCIMSKNKDEIFLEGNDLELVSRSGWF